MIDDDDDDEWNFGEEVEIPLSLHVRASPKMMDDT